MYRDFCQSAMDSIAQPTTQMMTPRTSLAVPNAGSCPLDTPGEFRMMTGRDTTQTQRICPVSNDSNFGGADRSA